MSLLLNLILASFNIRLNDLLKATTYPAVNCKMLEYTPYRKLQIFGFMLSLENACDSYKLSIARSKSIYEPVLEWCNFVEPYE